MMTFEKTPENVEKFLKTGLNNFKTSITYRSGQRAAADAKYLATKIPVDFLEYALPLLTNYLDKEACNRIIAAYYKLHPEEKVVEFGLNEIIKILKKEMQPLLEQYLASTEKFAREAFAFHEKRDKLTTAQWYEKYNVINTPEGRLDRTIQGNVERYYEYRKAWEASRKITLGGLDKLIAKELQLANMHYESSVNKLANRIQSENFDYTKLKTISSRVGVNIEIVFTDGTKTLKAYTIVAEGPIQRPHYRYLISKVK